jgi:alkanesulfonate monooxygenase SsuD/methylene tetrahydromethanopterin reductase-like flavin-dependent oxidoreductase (luciferase family)
VEFGLILTQFTDRWSHVENDARLAEEVGLDSVWLVDHLLSTSDAHGSLFEGWTALAFVAGITERVRLGHLVNCVSFRNPGLLAKMAATVDHASGGRLDLGLGAGWYQREYDAFDFPFGSAGERRRYFEEYVEALQALFSGQPVDYDGEFITLRGAVCRPGPVQQPHPPLVIGATGPLMRAFAGRRGDVWNAPVGLLKDIETSAASVREAAGDRDVRVTIQVPVTVGRTEEEADAAFTVGLTHMAWMGDIAAVGIGGTLDEAAEKVAFYRDAGVDGFIAVLPGSRRRPEFIEAYGELAARF